MTDKSGPPDSAAYSQKTNVVDVDPMAMKRVGVFTVQSGLEAGRLLTIPKGSIVTLGRSPECTYAFDDASLSREHAHVVRIATDYVLKDKGSTNGTFVNDLRTQGAVTLKDGDRVQLGLHTMLRFALVNEQEEAALGRVYNAAIKDGLTGVFNRKYLEERITTELAYGARHGTPLSVVIFDVDFFKKVNDTHGHLAGDTVLRAVAGILGSGLRAEDVLARYGGEEFVLLLRSTPLPDALQVAERLRSTIQTTPINIGTTNISVTASAGIASTAEFAAAERAQLLGTADGRLYRAKETGRNRVLGP